jgi:hypothetical protein
MQSRVEDGSERDNLIIWVQFGISYTVKTVE